MFGFKRKAAPPNLDQAIASMVEIGCLMAEDVLRDFAPDGHVVTNAERTRAARFISGHAIGGMRVTLKKAGASDGAISLMTKPIEARIFSEVRSYLHAKAPLADAKADGSA